MVIGAALIVLVFTSASAWGQSAEEWCDKGMAEYDSGSCETAVEYFTKACDMGDEWACDDLERLGE